MVDFFWTIHLSQKIHLPASVFFAAWGGYSCHFTTASEPSRHVEVYQYESRGVQPHHHNRRGRSLNTRGSRKKLGPLAGTFIKYLQNSQKTWPCFGLLIISHHIFSVGVYLISISTPWILYFTKNNLYLMCLVFLDHVKLVERRMVDLLYWWTVLWLIWYPCDYIKYLPHSISPEHHQDQRVQLWWSFLR